MKEEPERFEKQREEIIAALEKEKDLKIEEVKRIYEGELLKRDNEITKLKSHINLPPSKIEVIESSIPRKNYNEQQISSPSLGHGTNPNGNWTVVNSPTRKRGKANVMHSSPKSGESTASFWGPSALFLNNNQSSNKKGKRKK